MSKQKFYFMIKENNPHIYPTFQIKNLFSLSNFQIFIDWLNIFIKQYFCKPIEYKYELLSDNQI